MNTLPRDLYNRLVEALTGCDEFESDRALQSLFVLESLAPFRDGLPQAEDRRARVALCVDYLLARQHVSGVSALVLLLAALQEVYSAEDARRPMLSHLEVETRQVLSRPLEPLADCLKFVNREMERECLRRYLENGLHVQVRAPAGLGKSALLRQVQWELQQEGWTTVWIDFSCDEFRECIADRYQFMKAFARELWGEAAPDLVGLDEPSALQRLGRGLADLERVVLFLDNADRASSRLREWLRAVFLEKLAEWGPFLVVAAARLALNEWDGLRAGRPFYLLSLSGFDDPRVIHALIDDLIVRLGPRMVRRRREEATSEAWARRLAEMGAGVAALACGHPLVMERLLFYALERDGLLHPDFFKAHRAELVERCLAPVVDGHILPLLGETGREAFRSLCVFRYVWPGLIRALIEPGEAAWEPFSNGERAYDHWWRELQNTYLVHDVTVRRMYPLSPTIRKVVGQVLHQENPALYGQRQQRARQEYERLLVAPGSDPLLRTACCLEIFFHTAQIEGAASPEMLPAVRRYGQLLKQTLSPEEIEAALQVLPGWVREDVELGEVLKLHLGQEPGDALAVLVGEL